jgi:hypothetical protein
MSNLHETTTASSDSEGVRHSLIFSQIIVVLYRDAPLANWECSSRFKLPTVCVIDQLKAMIQILCKHSYTDEIQILSPELIQHILPIKFKSCSSYSGNDDQYTKEQLRRKLVSPT